VLVRRLSSATSCTDCIMSWKGPSVAMVGSVLEKAVGEVGTTMPAPLSMCGTRWAVQRGHKPRKE
jgi:hypothetical protein